MHGGETDLVSCSGVCQLRQDERQRGRERAGEEGERGGGGGSDRLPDRCVASGTVIAATTASVVVAVI